MHMTTYDTPVVVLKDDGHRYWGISLLEDIVRINSINGLAERIGAEPGDVEKSLNATLTEAKPGELVFDRLFRGCVEGVDLASVLQEVSAAPGEQVMVLIYRDFDWWSGMWNNKGFDTPVTDADLELSSVSAFYGTPMSEVVRNRRLGIEPVLEKAILKADYNILRQAMEYRSVTAKFGDFEAHPGVQLLASWWNNLAPEQLRSAAFAQFYVWDAENKFFQALDTEEPALSTEFMVGSGSLAVFHEDGGPVIVADFIRGRAHNLSDTFVFRVDGSEFWDVGLAREEVDDAYYCAASLNSLAELIPGL